jgi:hypothetical protein
MSLTECGKFDHDNNLKNKHSGWRKVSDAIREKGQSRKQRIMRKNGQ